MTQNVGDGFKYFRRNEGSKYLEEHPSAGKASKALCIYYLGTDAIALLDWKEMLIIRLYFERQIKV